MTPTRSSRLVEASHPDVDVVNSHPQYGVPVGGSRMRDVVFDVDSYPNVSGRERTNVTAGDSVKADDYRRVGRTALSAGKGI